MRAPEKSITIVGGGLAGLTLGIGLRQRGIPVVLWEAGTYPRHRVCGEFISGHGLETMQRLGLREALAETPTRPAATALFVAGARATRARALPHAALCVSRYELDARLAERFCQLGGELHCGIRWKAEGPGDGVVQATGRGARNEESGWHWYGLKAHASGLELAADLEMHFTERGYVGLCRLPGGLVNVCGLFRRGHGDPGLPRDIADRFCATSDSSLGQRLRRAAWLPESTCAVAGLSYRAHHPRPGFGCAIGDALDMIPPVTGNGMSLAFESAELALEPLAEFATGHTDWLGACERLRTRFRQAFSRRLRIARLLHHAIFSAPVRTGLWPLVNRSEWLWRFLFKMTR